MMKTQYAYASEPKAAVEQQQQQQRKLYRSDDVQSGQRPVNIMYDRRIYRGNTYASPVLPAYAQPDALELQRQQQQRRKLKAARRAEAARRPRTPDAVEGRQHMEVQTELYLEELGDTVPEATVSTQTDAFLDRAPSPLYVPVKAGVDASTQILDGDLFDFDVEVEPLLEVLVGKTLERARAEVLQEAELAALRRRQRDHAARRAAEQAEVHRLEQAEKRRTEEKERRKAEAARLLQEKNEAAKKVAATSFASVYLSSLVPATLSSLQDEGYFYNTREREIQQMFLPWLTGQVEARVQRIATARAIIDGLILEAFKRKTYSNQVEPETVAGTPEIPNEQATIVVVEHTEVETPVVAGETADDAEQQNGQGSAPTIAGDGATGSEEQPIADTTGGATASKVDGSETAVAVDGEVKDGEEASG